MNFPPVFQEVSVSSLLEHINRGEAELDAVLVGDERLTYAKLAERSDKLASILLRSGIKTQDRVALYMDRSVELVVGIVATLRAGAIYVPLDVNAPSERVEWMIQDAKPRVLLTLRRYKHSLPSSVMEDSNILVIVLDEPRPGRNAPVQESTTTDVADSDAQSQNQIAYIIYTSGSTGRPKGVMVTHRNVISSTLARSGVYDTPPIAGNRVLIPVPFTFDGAMGAFWWTLFNGGTVVLPEPDRATDASYIAQLIKKAGITHTAILTTLYGLVLDVAIEGDLNSLKVVTVGGEVLPPGLVGQHHSLLPETHLFNEYGPTECTVWATAYKTSPEDQYSPVVPIGRVAGHLKPYILDQSLREVETESRGMLFLGGEGVAAGYLNRPDLTEASFIQSPFDRNDRLYKTGDLVKSDSLGILSYVGRLDDQVKIGGVRIELGEIDKALFDIPGVLRAAAMAREFGGRRSSAKTKQLVAFVQLNSGADLTVSDIRQALSATLPSAMVPTHILILENMPVLSSGKIDRKQLQSIDVEKGGIYAPLELPRNAVEQTIWDVWQNYFATDTFGIRSNFFSLGGHSLLATQIVLRLNTIFRVNLSVRELFAFPTIAEYADLVHSIVSHKLNNENNGNSESSNYQSSLFSADSIPTTERTHSLSFTVPASFPQRRMWFAYKYDPHGYSYNLPIAIRIRGNLNINFLKTALNRIVQRHEAFRTVFSSVDGNAIQLVRPFNNDDDINIEQFDLSDVASENKHAQLDTLLQQESRRPFDIENGPPFRFAIINLEQESKSNNNDIDNHDNTGIKIDLKQENNNVIFSDIVLFVVMHHIMSDHWSLAIFLRELESLYREVSEGVIASESSLSPNSIRYSDFAAWQRKTIENDTLSSQRKFWVEKLKELPVLSLSTDFPRPERQSLRGSRVSVPLPEGLLDSVSHMSAEMRATPYILMLAAFNLLMSRHSGQSDFAVGTPVSGRKHPDLENVIGVFINTLVLRTNLDGIQTYEDVIERVRGTLIEAFANEDVPYEQIVEDLGGMRDTSYSPVIQVLFNVQNAPVKIPEINNSIASFIPIDFDAGATQFDLVFNLDTALGKHLEVAYATDLFREETIRNIIQEYFTLLRKLIANPRESISDQIVSDLATRAIHQPVKFEKSEAVRISPRNGIEEALWDIWSAVLKHSDFGVKDDFFIAGGHSLLATQVASRIRDVLQIDVPLRTLFENPTIERLANVIDESSKRGNSIADIPPVARLPRYAGQPLIAPTSFSQRRMWMVQEANPEGTAYNMPFAIRLKGKLDKKVFAAALESVVQRHEAFRTSIRVVNGEPVQVIEPEPTPLEIKEFDFSGVRSIDRMREVEEALRDESLQTFKLDNAPLYRMTLVKVSEEEHIFLWLMHHVIGDQWSAGTTFHELTISYNAIKKGKDPIFAERSIDYPDFAAWQRQHLGGNALDSQLEFWRQNLSGLDVLALPLDRPRPATQSFRGENLVVDLQDSFVEKLHRWSAARGLTSYMTLLGAFQVVLSRYSGQTNVAVGSPIANRTRSESENLLGTLVNTLVMRAELGDDPTFENFLTRVRDNTLNAYANQDIPFERLVDELVTTRDTSHSPLVQVLFNVVNAPFDIQPFEGVEIDLFSFDAGSVQFDLSMSIGTDEFKKINLGYSTALFNRETAQRILDSYVSLLNQVISDPGKRISEYDLINSEDRDKVLYKWNQTESDYPLDKRVDDLIALNALTRTNSVAVSMGDQFFTYGELNKSANRLARHLRRKGIGLGNLVGICHDRSPQMVVALLAVIKSGAAYVPLDPAFPRERLELMAETAGLSAIITQSHLNDLISLKDSSVYILNLDTMQDELQRESSDAIHPIGTLKDPAYVLFTSGSTGTPKGVVIPHLALTNFLISMQREPGCTSDDVLLSVTTLSFDISGLEIFLPLIAGGRVELASKDEIVDGRKLVAKMEDCKPTIMQATPATWRMLIDSGWTGVKSLKVLCGGEALSPELGSALIERCGELWNMYGPTETTIWSTVELITRTATAENLPQITIGRPISNTTIYILDPNHKPVPIGVTGELFIGGEGVAIGYHNRQDLTDERFLKDPFSTKPDSRIYKTGDLAKWLPDGRIVHQGRMDFQVKIRGFRIELGEIESVIAKYPKVAQVVVAAKDDAQNMPQLVAYIILHEEGASSDNYIGEFAHEIRDHVRNVLPAYMVPAHVMLMDEFPLTANNKVNVKALPQPGSDATAIDIDVFSEPADTLTLQLLLLWRQVLGTEAVGVDDSFFDLGGHSLKAVQLLSYVNKLIGKELPLAMLFQAPTVAKMVKLLTQDGWKPSWRSLVAINAAGRKLPVFTVPGVGGNVIMFSQFSKLLGPQTPVYGLQARGLDGKTEPFTSITDMAAHNIHEIKSVHPQGPYVIVGICTGGIVAYEMAQQLRKDGDDPILIMADTWHPSSYKKSIIPEWLMEKLRPVQFWMSKLFDYTKQIITMSPLKWREFIKSKLNRASVVLEQGDVESVLTAGSYYRQKMKEATINAIIEYEAKPYNHPFLYVYASLRKTRLEKHDTRKLWKTLSNETTEKEISAIDSGQIFVSPNVEQMVEYVNMYVEDYGIGGRERLSSGVEVLN